MDRDRTRIVGEVVQTVALRSVVFGVLAWVLLEELAGAVDPAFLVVTVFVVVVMHEALHMVGMEVTRTQHLEKFKLLAVGYVALDAPTGQVLLAVLLPFLALFPMGFVLVSTGFPSFVAIGWAVIAMHVVLLPIELGTAHLRDSPAQETVTTMLQ